MVTQFIKVRFMVTVYKGKIYGYTVYKGKTYGYTVFSVAL